MSRFLLLAAILASFSCGNRSPHDNFISHMQHNINKNIDGESTNWVKSKYLIRTRTLSNGNKENQYQWRGSCIYFFEFNPDTRVIINWRFEGSKKDCQIPL